MAQLWVSHTLLIVSIILGPVSWCCVMLWFASLALQGLHRQFVQIRQIQTIPCYRCAYFSGDEQLRCAVHPYSALTASAKDCRDFTPATSPQDVTWMITRFSTTNPANNPFSS
ncbi:MAG: hypothetical protein F6K00_31040 [Leptolyngbya sp. SIOISBB]|nr:hypothetical protein [Leptolyngbya sp. SIOISBB]